MEFAGMASARRRNVLLFLADQWRGDTLRNLGHKLVATPAIDALAADGVTFSRCFTTATPCGPARGSLLTGQYMMNHRVVWNGTPLDRRHTNLAIEMRRLGYEPAMFGYTSSTPDPRDHSPDDPALREAHGNMVGFVDIAPGLPTARPYMSHVRRLGYDVPDDPNDFWLPDPDAARDAERRGKGPTWAPSRFPPEHSDNAFLVDQAISYIGAMGDRPWFVHVATMRPHPPFIAPRPYHDMFRPEDVPPPHRAASAKIEAGQHPVLDLLLATTLQIDYFRTGRGLASALDERAVRQLRATYYGMMAELDLHLARLIRFLKDSGQYDDTLIVFSSDHGEMLGNHHLLGKLGYFDDAFHIPLIVRVPGADARRGAIVDELVETIDAMPTILDWLGVEPPIQCQGASLLGMCRGVRPRAWRDAVHFEFDYRFIPGADALQPRMDRMNLAVVRDRRWKYVHAPGLRPLLFDLGEDPLEYVDRAGDPGCAARLSECRARLLDWRIACADQTLTGMQATPSGLAVRRDPPRWG
jgi:arylsulfatase A-like enzyme